MDGDLAWPVGVLNNWKSQCKRKRSPAYIDSEVGKPKLI